jgi:hypothetical protein
MDELPAWLSAQQAAAYCGVGRTEMYTKMLRDLEVRRIGVRGGASPLGRLIRVERGSLLRLCGSADMPLAELPRWVTMRQAAEYYQVSPYLIRDLIAHERLLACRIGSSKTIRIDRDSLLHLGRFKIWTPS